MHNDLIVGCVTGYEYDQIEPWLSSIKSSGFSGKVAIIAYNMTKETSDKLTENGVSFIFGVKQNEKGDMVYERPGFNICVERFAHQYFFLREMSSFDYIISTDVKDVVFQRNPSVWLRENIGANKNIIVGTENLRYKDEPWGKNNFNLSFGPFLYEVVKNNPIYCAGVIAGRHNAFVDLCLNIFLICRGNPDTISGGGGSDQAALNMLLSLDAYKEQTKFLTTKDSFVCHAGTSLHAIRSGSGTIGQTFLQDAGVMDEYKECLLNDDCLFKDGLVCTSDGEPYCVVHQYDRVHEWKGKMIHEN